jgi:hypothetical protein
MAVPLGEEWTAIFDNMKEKNSRIGFPCIWGKEIII